MEVNGNMKETEKSNRTYLQKKKKEKKGEKNHNHSQLQFSKPTFKPSQNNEMIIKAPHLPGQ